MLSAFSLTHDHWSIMLELFFYLEASLNEWPVANSTIHVLFCLLFIANKWTSFKLNCGYLFITIIFKHNYDDCRALLCLKIIVINKHTKMEVRMLKGQKKKIKRPENVMWHLLGLTRNFSFRNKDVWKYFMNFK